MGIILFICFREETSTMGSALVVCLAALAAAEPEADAFYGSYGYGSYGLGYSNLGYAPLRYSGAYGYAAPATSAGIAVRGYGTPATIGTNMPYGYAASGHYVADSFGAVHVAKREADAEPEAEADALYGSYGYGYNNLGYSNLGYNNLGYSNLGLSAYSKPVVSTVSRIAAPVVSSYSTPVVSRPALISRASGIWKREAEAEPEADADAFYGSYGYNNIGYSSYSRPIVSSYSRPIVSRPIVSSYSRPIVSGYSSIGYSRPLVSGYSSIGRIGLRGLY